MGFATSKLPTPRSPSEVSFVHMELEFGEWHLCRATWLNWSVQTEWFGHDFRARQRRKLQDQAYHKLLIVIDREGRRQEYDRER